jgi:hypothetical protein
MQDLRGGSALDDPALVHDRDARRGRADHRHVVSHHDQRHAGRAHEILEQREHLRLRRHIQCRRRLIGDQHRRLEHTAIAIATRCRPPPDSSCG